nr:hypothetical protein [uncultured Acinetobacter sp.]
MNHLTRDYRSLEKWLNKRRGRLSQLASQMEMKRQTLWSNIYCYRIDQHTMNRIKGYMVQIEHEEKQAKRLLGRLNAWMYRGNGRQKQLASWLGISTVSMRKIAKSKGDGQYVLLKYGLQNIRNGIAHIEHETQGGFKTHIQTVTNLYRPLKNKYFRFDQLHEILDNVRNYANYGKMSAALVYQEYGIDQFKILSIGFDSKHSGMLDSHVCDIENPHVHAAFMLKLNLAKVNAPSEIGTIGVLADHMPCGECAENLVNTGVSQIHFFQIDDLGNGKKVFQFHNIATIKANY